MDHILLRRVRLSIFQHPEVDQVREDRQIEFREPLILRAAEDLAVADRPLARKLADHRRRDGRDEQLQAAEVACAGPNKTDSLGHLLRQNKRYSTM